MNFTIYKIQTGEIVTSGICLDSDFKNQIVPENCLIINIGSDPVNQYIQNNIAVNKPIKLNEYFVFNYDTKQWVDPRTNQTEWVVVRNKRERLLLASDWTQLPDVEITNKSAWATYRQALRNITTQSDPFNITWPTPPES